MNAPARRNWCLVTLLIAAGATVVSAIVCWHFAVIMNNVGVRASDNAKAPTDPPGLWMKLFVSGGVTLLTLVTTALIGIRLLFLIGEARPSVSPSGVTNLTTDS